LTQVSHSNIAKKPLKQRAEISSLMQIISLAHYRTAPKYKVITILKYHMDIHKNILL